MLLWLASIATFLLSTTAFVCARPRKLKNTALSESAPTTPDTLVQSTQINAGEGEDGEVKPRLLLPSSPDALKTYKTIVMGKTRPVKDNETIEDVKSDWGDVQAVEKPKKKVSSKAPKKKKSLESPGNSNESGDFDKKPESKTPKKKKPLESPKSLRSAKESDEGDKKQEPESSVYMDKLNR
uniref:Uncharacterized protein n=1 Tax=Steinernema glaseri TaxID=37863 RepID=A0A1I7XXE0_9BILA